MKVILIHNFYQLAGGEDAVFKNEQALLQKKGHEVIVYTTDNSQISTLFAKMTLVVNAIFSFSQYRKLKAFLTAEKPDVVHVHNYFPIISPAVFYACKKVGVPVVHTLHNYRAICPTALLMHDGKVNERSVTHNSWWTVWKKVYRDSVIGSFSLACMVELHKHLGTWQSKVSVFIALTEFAKSKYKEAGWPVEKIRVKPNFIEDPFNGKLSIDKRGGYAIYIGRLSEEKGINILLSAWQGMEFPLKIIGDGPLKSVVESNTSPFIEYLGLKSKTEVLELVQNANFIVMASTWFEGFPMVLVEAFACGTPAIVPKLGSMEEIITPNKTGLHFETNEAEALAKQVNLMIANPNETLQMGKNARLEYLNYYTPEKNIELLEGIYRAAFKQAL
ncbi:MAG: glycosyltransferase family 4 protein [Paraglaciecola sp.]|uniref:glycosyltransferase family 4 protein n=1 Tax=Paraglaciecola sp. TaxID=1920173 RepID=UPI003299C37B